MRGIPSGGRDGRGGIEGGNRSGLGHIGIIDGGRGRKGLLDRMGAEPADHVQASAGFIIGAGGPGSAEGLLADDGAGTFVVDVEVAGCISESCLHLGDGKAVLGEDGAGQGVG